MRMPDCPQCGTWIVRQARRRGTREHLLRFLLISPFRCQLCTHRFLAIRGGPSYDPRREYERILVRYPVAFSSAVSGDQAEAAEGTLVNVSIRGCRIESHPPAPQGARLRIGFVTDAHEPPIEVEGAVVRNAVGDCMGLEFFKIRREEEDRLRHVIEAWLLARPH